jgi:hypothetical protein
MVTLGRHIMPAAALTSVRRHYSYVTFVICAFGVMWFTRWPWADWYGTNLGLELAAYQASGMTRL